MRILILGWSPPQGDVRPGNKEAMILRRAFYLGLRKEDRYICWFDHSVQGAHLTRCPPTFSPSPQCPPPPTPANVDIVNCAQIPGVENFAIGEGILDKSRHFNHLGWVG